MRADMNISVVDIGRDAIPAGLLGPAMAEAIQEVELASCSCSCSCSCGCSSDARTFACTALGAFTALALENVTPAGLSNLLGLAVSGLCLAVTQGGGSQAQASQAGDANN
jgi:hypothetical protein